MQIFSLCSDCVCCGLLTKIPLARHSWFYLCSKRSIEVSSAGWLRTFSSWSAADFVTVVALLDDPSADDFSLRRFASWKTVRHSSFFFLSRLNKYRGSCFQLRLEVERGHLKIKSPHIRLRPTLVRGTIKSTREMCRPEIMNEKKEATSDRDWFRGQIPSSHLEEVPAWDNSIQHNENQFSIDPYALA